MPSMPQFFSFVTGKSKPSPRVYPYTANDNLNRRSRAMHSVASPFASKPKNNGTTPYIDPDTARREGSGQYLQLEEC